MNQESQETMGRREKTETKVLKESLVRRDFKETKEIRVNVVLPVNLEKMVRLVTKDPKETKDHPETMET